MADRFGALALPVPAPAVSDPHWKTRAAGDPCLLVLGSFLATTITALCDAAYRHLEPGLDRLQLGAEADLGATGSIVRRVRFYNPVTRPFMVEDLPAIFVFRGGDRGSYQPYASDRFRKTSTITVFWAARQVDGEVQVERDPFLNAIGDAAACAVRDGYHPSWVLSADKAKPGSIASSVTGEAAAWTVSGAALDGSLASSTLAIPRPVLITTSGTTVPGSVVVNGIGAKNRPWQDTAAITTTDGGESLLTIWRFAKVTSVEFQGQTTSARFSIGYAASPEARQGSRMKRAAGMQECMLRRPGEIRDLTIPSAPGQKPIVLRVYEMQFEVVEDRELDPLGRGASANNGADGTYQIPPQSQGDMPDLPFAQTFATSSF